MGVLAGRITSGLVVAGGWLFLGARLVLDLVGYSTFPEDSRVALGRLGTVFDWLLSVPWWAALGFALIASMWLMWVSWPRANFTTKGRDGPILEDAQRPHGQIADQSSDNSAERWPIAHHPSVAPPSRVSKKQGCLLEFKAFANKNGVYAEIYVEYQRATQGQFGEPCKLLLTKVREYHAGVWPSLFEADLLSEYVDRNGETQLRWGPGPDVPPGSGYLFFREDRYRGRVLIEDEQGTQQSHYFIIKPSPDGGHPTSLDQSVFDFIPQFEAIVDAEQKARSRGRT